MLPKPTPALKRFSYYLEATGGGFETVDISGIVVTQGKLPTDDVVKMAQKAEIAIFSTDLNRWQVATKLYEAGIR